MRYARTNGKGRIAYAPYYIKLYNKKTMAELLAIKRCRYNIFFFKYGLIFEQIIYI
jgi:hypothetical protein